MRIASRLIVAGCLVGMTLVGAGRAMGAGEAGGAATSPAGTGTAVYDRVAKEFLDGKWEEVQQDLTGSAREIDALPAEQKADVTYIKGLLAEARPAWWKECKAGKKTLLKPVMWGRVMVATYDPEAKSGVQVSWGSGTMKITVTWPAADMDNPAQAEHGYTKGELNDLGIWCTLGTSDGYSRLSENVLNSLGTGSEATKLQLMRYLDFRGDVGGVYGGLPRARRWGLWLYLAGYMDKYAKMQTVMGRRALGAMFVTELLEHPDRYPSIKLPRDVPADGAEGKVALAVKDWIEGHGWTVREDRMIREATKAFAAANEKTTQVSGKVTLANGLTLALDPDADKALSGKRDAWVKEQLGKAKGAKAGG